MDKKQNRKVIFSDLGLVPYPEALEIQTQAFTTIVDTKILNRTLPIDQQQETDNYLFFFQHPHVYTLGRSGVIENLLVSEEFLKNKEASFYKSSRGGDITYHGPGQLIAYPILDLDNFFTDIHKYMRILEETVILTLKDFGIASGRIPGLTGVWIDHENSWKSRKICAFGVKTSRWVTMHGLSLNIHTDLSYFENIVPCGIADKAVTSMEKELSQSISLAEVSDRLLFHFSTQFEMTIARKAKHLFIE